MKTFLLVLFFVYILTIVFVFFGWYFLNRDAEMYETIEDVLYDIPYILYIPVLNTSIIIGSVIVYGIFFALTYLLKVTRINKLWDKFLKTKIKF